MEFEDLTVVYDKGNVSKANQALVDEASFGCVALLTPAHHAELMAIPARHYTPLSSGPLDSEQLRAGQMRGLQQHLHQRLKTLSEWREQLSKPRSGPRTKESALQRIDALRSGQFINEVLHVEFEMERRR